MPTLPAIEQLRSLLPEDRVTRPRWSPEAVAALGEARPVVDGLGHRQLRLWEDAPELEAARLVIEAVGLPTNLALRFKPVETITREPEARRFRYVSGGRVVHACGGIRLGVNRLGACLLVPPTGHLVYVDDDPGGPTELVNTSIERLLYFVGRFEASADRQFHDVDRLAADLWQVDPTPLSDPNNGWSVLLEEAAAGLYS